MKQCKKHNQSFTLKSQLLIFTALSTLCLLFSTCKNQKPGSQSTAIRVKTQEIRDSVFVFPIRTAGKLENAKQIRLSFKTGGMIDRLWVEEGQEVKKGEQLASLKLDEIKGNVTLAKLAEEKAGRDLQRIKNLYSDSVATLEQLQNATTALDLAQTQRKIAEFNLNHSSIVAPTSGVVLKILAEAEEMIAPGHPVFLFGSKDQSWIYKTNVSDVQRVKIDGENKAIITFDALPDSTFLGSISLVSDFADPYTGTYSTEIQISDPDARFVSGLIGKAEIFPETRKKYVYIPLDAIIRMNDLQAKVFVIENHLPVEKTINLAEVRDTLAIVSYGLKPGEQLITEGGHYIQPGSKIQINK